jgi:putative acetyltransferase
MRTYYAWLMIIRDEVPVDIEAIRSVVTAAFDGARHASGSEAAIVDALRANGALTLSLVAVEDGAVVGHAAYSPVLIDGKDAGWFGLGPIAVMDSVQRRGIGKALIESGIRRLTTMGAHGCVVLGEPAYYGRFGFESDANLRFPGAPEQYFQRLLLNGRVPAGLVEYHSAFD